MTKLSDIPHRFKLTCKDAREPLVWVCFLCKEEVDRVPVPQPDCPFLVVKEVLEC